jgi:hypothetical protein
MIKLAQGFFRKSVFKTYRWFKHPRRLKKSALMRWFARHFLSKQVWKPTQHTLAGGLAIGMCIMIQMSPGQMLVAAVLAALFRVNIPIAVMACWISNPFTFVPFLWLQKVTGELAMPWLPEIMQNGIHSFADMLVRNIEQLPAFVRDEISDDFARKGVDFVAEVYLGGAMIGILLIPISYVLAWGIWEYFARVARNHQRREAAGLV